MGCEGQQNGDRCRDESAVVHGQHLADADLG
jgi:hypothetical protein